MSLLKQLLLSVSVAMLGILLGTLFFNVDAARQSLSEQLQLQSDNAASSLALSLSQPANQDAVVRELLMAALFDTGHFDAIRLTDPAGRRLFEREMDEQAAQNMIQAAPLWFQQFIPLPKARTQRAVSNGWSQVGTLDVEVDNRFAIDALWRTSLRMAVLVLVAGAAWAIFVGSLLRWFQRVLHEEVASQVMRIGTEDAQTTKEQTSQVRELQAVSEAIQTTHQRVQRTEQAQAARIESLELETHSDSVTGLPNRKYFLNELNKALQADVHGHVLLVRQRDLQAMNASWTRSEVDAWLQGVAQQVQDLLSHSEAPDAQLARLNGSDFAIMLPSDLGPAALHVVEQLRKTMQSLNVALTDGQWSRWAFVLTPFTQDDSATTVLTRLDQGMMKAESEGHGEVEYAESGRPQDAAVLAGEGHWQQLLVNALHTPGQLRLHAQPVASSSLTGNQHWHEAGLELQPANGKVLGAGLFLPAAVRLGLSDDYDHKALHLALQWLAEHPHTDLVLRISLASIEQEFFAQRVAETLSNPLHQPLLPNLILELDAFTLESAARNTLALCALAAKAGVQIGLRRLEQSPKALLHLNSLRLRYVKVSGFFAELALRNPGAAHLLEAMLETVHAQSATVLITDAVNPQAADWLRAKGASLQLPNVEK